MTKIICLNGPIECGKDTIGTLLETKLPRKVKIEKFAQPIRDAAIATFPQVTEENFEQMKPQKLLGSNLTLRKWAIEFSEHFMKPLCGEDVFGQLLLSRLLKEKEFDFVVITDCGFFEEVQVLENWYGSQNLILFQIYRKGKTFDGDSRGYVFGMQNLEAISNQEDAPEEVVDEILCILDGKEMLGKKAKG